MSFSLIFFLFYSLTIFIIGFIGIFMSKKNFIIVLISLEIMFLAVNINLALCGLFFNDVSPHIFLMFTLVIAGSEAAIGLGLFVAYFKKTQFFNIESLKGIKG